MIPADNTQADYLNMLKEEGREHTMKCGSCGVWWGEEHLSSCKEPTPIVVELTQADKDKQAEYKEKSELNTPGE